MKFSGGLSSRKAGEAFVEQEASYTGGSNSLSSDSPIADRTSRTTMMNKLSTRFYGKSTTETNYEDILPASSKVANFNNKMIGDAGLYEIGEILKINRVAEMLLVNNRLTEEGLRTIISPLEKNSSLTTFDISHNQLRDSGLEMLAQSFEHSPSLISLNINDNKLTRLAAPVFSDVLKISKLQILDIGNNTIYPETAQHIAEALPSTSLVELRANRCKFGNKGVKVLMEAVKKTKSLTALSLADNEITSEGARFILENIRYSGVLHLNVAFNHTGDDIAGDLIEVLLSNQLLSLNLGGMDLGEQSISAVSENLGKLQSLVLQSNPIDDNAISILMGNVRDSSTLTHLNLRSCLEGDVLSSIRHIAAVLSESKLEWLELQVNNLNDKCAPILASGWSGALAQRTDTKRKKRSNLKVLDLGLNEISDDGLQGIANELQSLSSGAVIKLDNNLISDQGVEIVLKALQEGSEELDVEVDLSNNSSISPDSYRKLKDWKVTRDRKKKGISDPPAISKRCGRVLTSEEHDALVY
eukprot:TRINITY_DN10422_c0_g1_i1.p1 TRINITY_DN10422_c0_g1~~TRINITY_DN10422_c0_g1_i1.p1  ORF type:complete len:528 (-),score=107.78 TRINITY_DN10422_c0_g1_i1:129-1712(-)